MKLTAFEHRWAEAALVAIFPGSAEHGLTGIGSMNVGAFLEDLMRSLPFKAALGFRAAIWMVAVAPLFVLGRLALFGWLDRAERERVIETLATCRTYALRSLVLLLKTLGALLYASDDRVRARMEHRSSPSPLVRLRAGSRDVLLSQELVDVRRAPSVR